jgi:hypothetical protein
MRGKANKINEVSWAKWLRKNRSFYPKLLTLGSRANPWLHDSGTFCLGEKLKIFSRK